MHILLFAESESCIAGFEALRKSRSHTVEVHSSRELKPILREAPHDTFVYLDATGHSIPSIRSRMKLLVELVPGRFGIVDQNSSLIDSAEAFHRGASDYIDGRVLKEALSVVRFGRVMEFARQVAVEAHVRFAESADFHPSGVDWDDVVNGEEYTFQMLYVGIDYMKDMRRKSSEDLLRTLRRTLQSILTRSFSSVGGRIWVWKEDDGVLLIPFDGEQITALIPAVRLVLNRVLINIEEFAVTTPISWRMGIHLGNTPYEASGNTSAIVSEALNFIFHLGQRALKPGQLAVTGSAFALVPEKVSRWLVRGADFESTPFYLLREFE